LRRSILISSAHRFITVLVRVIISTGWCALLAALAA
jgi:hypothetical protein